MKEFSHCIVTLIDLIGVRRLLKLGGPMAVKKMRHMHRTINQNVGCFGSNTELVFWNDSVLIHSIVEQSAESYESSMLPIIKLKASIDALHSSYAISVKGKSFPLIKIRKSGTGCRLVYLSASSLAFTNCFDIEAELKTNSQFKNRRYGWYIDDRIIKRICKKTTRPADDKYKFNLFPEGEKRFFHMFHGTFFGHELTPTHRLF